MATGGGGGGAHEQLVNARGHDQQRRHGRESRVRASIEPQCPRTRTTPATRIAPRTIDVPSWLPLPLIHSAFNAPTLAWARALKGEVVLRWSHTHPKLA